MQIDLKQIFVRPLAKSEEPRYRELMQQHHYLGDLSKIGHTLWYVALLDGLWIALLSFSASALKCAARDNWIGWDYRHQYGRLKLIANNSRFLILPDWHLPNLGSKVLALCQKRIASDWLVHFKQPLLLLETFVDPTRFKGTVYRAANWKCLGQTQGSRRIQGGYSARTGTPKLVFVRALQHDTQAQLSQAVIATPYRQESPKIMLAPEHMSTLPSYFKDIADPRRAQGRRHPLPVVLAIAAGATLCGMDSYKAMAGWAKDLGAKARERFGCRIENKLRIVPSETIIRDVLIRVDPDALDRALQRWNAEHVQGDQSLAIDGKTMCNAIDENGRQTHIMSVIGHESAQCYTQKKVGTLSVQGSDEAKQTNEIGMFTQVLDAIDIEGKTITADALLTQYKLASYVVERKAHYHFSVKGNQKTLAEDIALLFQKRSTPHHEDVTPADHGRIETRRIWCSTQLNEHINFPHVGQVFLIERDVVNKKTGKRSVETALGITSQTPEQASPKQVLAINRGHWSIENSCHYVIDWNYNEDRSRISKGFGPENVTRLRRLAVGVIKRFITGSRISVAEKMQQLNRNTRLVFDYLRMTKNATRTSAAAAG